MKQIAGQETIEDYLKEQNNVIFKHCGLCVCRNCLYEQSGRCPYGTCYDSRRAKETPYDKAHPDNPPRIHWSNWKTDQAYWCRGGVFYPVSYCEKFVKYQGCEIKECLKCNVAVFQDGYIDCSLIENFGCERCYEEWEWKNDCNTN